MRLGQRVRETVPRGWQPSGKNVSRAFWGAKCCARLIIPPVCRGCSLAYQARLPRANPRRKAKEATVAAQYDLLLKGGTVIDPSQGLQQRCEVAFRDGRVAALVPDLPIAVAQSVIDVSGYLVTPGLLDIHGDFFYRGLPRAVHPDTACLPSGVTTAVDAGST